MTIPIGQLLAAFATGAVTSFAAEKGRRRVAEHQRQNEVVQNFIQDAIKGGDMAALQDPDFQKIIKKRGLEDMLTPAILLTKHNAEQQALEGLVRTMTAAGFRQDVTVPTPFKNAGETKPISEWPAAALGVVNPTLGQTKQAQEATTATAKSTARSAAIQEETNRINAIATATDRRYRRTLEAGTAGDISKAFGLTVKESKNVMDHFTKGTALDPTAADKFALVAGSAGSAGSADTVKSKLDAALKLQTDASSEIDAILVSTRATDKGKKVELQPADIDAKIQSANEKFDQSLELMKQAGIIDAEGQQKRALAMKRGYDHKKKQLIPFADSGNLDPALAYENELNRLKTNLPEERRKREGSLKDIYAALGPTLTELPNDMRVAAVKEIDAGRIETYNDLIRFIQSQGGAKLSDRVSVRPY